MESIFFKLVFTLSTSSIRNSRPSFNPEQQFFSTARPPVRWLPFGETYLFLPYAFLDFIFMLLMPGKVLILE